MKPGLADLYAVSEATWPPARTWNEGAAILRDGHGGGKRVSAATADRVPDDLSALEDAMRAMQQAPLFMIREGDRALDDVLAGRRYHIVDPVHVYLAPITALTDLPVPPVTCFAVWPPLAIMAEIWAQGGIGPARLDVMARTSKGTGLFARWREKPAGVGFAGVHGNVAMVHAVEVLPHQRRQGVAQWIMRKAAFWACENGAEWISVLCTEANTGANRLYQSMGFEAVGAYHYRMREET